MLRAGQADPALLQLRADQAGLGPEGRQGQRAPLFRPFAPRTGGVRRRPRAAPRPRAATAARRSRGTRPRALPGTGRRSGRWPLPRSAPGGRPRPGPRRRRARRSAGAAAAGTRCAGPAASRPADPPPASKHRPPPLMFTVRAVSANGAPRASRPVTSRGRCSPRRRSRSVMGSGPDRSARPPGQRGPRARAAARPRGRRRARSGPARPGRCGPRRPGAPGAARASRACTRARSVAASRGAGAGRRAWRCLSARHMISAASSQPGSRASASVIASDRLLERGRPRSGRGRAPTCSRTRARTSSPRGRGGLGQRGARARPAQRVVDAPASSRPDLVQRRVALVRVLAQHAVHDRGQARGQLGVQGQERVRAPPG